MANFSFDSRNRLVSAGETSYRYDAENQRIGVNQTRYVVNSQPVLSQVLVKEENHLVTTLRVEMPPGRSASRHHHFRKTLQTRGGNGTRRVDTRKFVNLPPLTNILTKCYPKIL